VAARHRHRAPARRPGRPPPAAQGRLGPVSLTARGHDLLAAVETIYADLEAGWAGTVGRAEIEQVRSVLVAVLAARHGGVLPPVRPTW
jgi:hypothetical protein